MSSVAAPNMFAPAPPVMSLSSEKAWSKFKNLFEIFALSYPTIAMRQLISVEWLPLVKCLLATSSASSKPLKSIEDADLILIIDAHFAPKTTVEFVGRLKKINFNGKITRTDIANFASSFTHCFESVDTKLHPKASAVYKIFIENIGIAPLQEELQLQSFSSLNDLVLHTFDWLDRAEKSGLLKAFPKGALKKLDSHDLDDTTKSNKPSVPPTQIGKGWNERLRPRNTQDSSTPGVRFDSNPPRSSNRDPRASDAWRTHANRVDGKPKPSTPNVTARAVRTAFVSPPVVTTATESTVQVSESSHQDSLIPSQPIALVHLFPTDVLTEPEPVVTAALLDTGATINLIRRDILEKFSPDSYFIRNVRPRDLIVADGLPTQRLQQEVELTVRVTVTSPVPLDISTHFYIVDTCSDPVILSDTWLTTNHLDDLLSHVRTTPLKPVPISEPLPLVSEPLDFEDYADSAVQEFHIDPELTSVIDTQLQEYDDLFHFDSESARLPPVNLQVPDDAIWSVFKPRRTSPAVAESVKAELDELLALGIIVPSASSRVSPIVPVRKSDGNGYRLCIDYRELNQHTPRVPFAQLSTHDTIQRLSGNHFFAKLDLSKGFFQIALHPDSQAATAFLTSFGQFQFTRLPQGVSNGTSYFHTRIAHEFRDLQAYVSVYVDDICIHCPTKQIYLDTINIVFQRCRDLHLVLKKSKCQFNLKTIEFLGYLVSSQGYTLPLSRRQGLADLTPPWDTSSCRSFVGFTNCFKSFISNYAELMKPLTTMCSTKVPFTWTSETQDIFQIIKDLAYNAPVLHFVDPQRPLCLFTDASTTALSGVLLQPEAHVTPDTAIPTQDLARSKPIAFISRVFDDTQQRWSIPEKELFAVLFAIRSLDHVFAGRKFFVFTDHKNFVHLHQSTSPKLIRWRLALQEYSFVIKHIKGKDNRLADHLSRPNLTQPAVCASVTDQSLPETTPVSFSTDLFHSVHGPLVGHNGIDRTLAQLATLGVLITPVVRASVSTLIESCAICQKVRGSRANHQAALHTTMVSEPFTTLYADFVGPLPTSESGCKYIIVVVDAFTRFCELVPSDDATADSFARALIPIVSRYGLFEELRSDQGVHFTAKITARLLEFLNIDHVMSVPYRPQSQGIVERLNAEVMRHLKAFTLPLKDATVWPTYLPLVQRLLNSAVHKTTGVSPASLLYGNAIDLNRHLFPSTARPSLSPPPSRITPADYVDQLQHAQRKLTEIARINQQQHIDA